MINNNSTNKGERSTAHGAPTPHSPLPTPHEHTPHTELYCIGNALVDVFARGEEDVDFRFGLTEPVQHIPMEKMNEILAVLPEFQAASGGGAANAAKIAAMLGVGTVFSGAVARDRFGGLFERELSGAGVDCRLTIKPGSTGLCLALLMPDGRRRIAASPGAALEYGAADLDEEALREAKAAVFDGYMLGRQDLARRVLGLASHCGTAVALDLSSPGIAQERALEVLTYARAYPLILFMNEDEARAFYRALSHDEDTSANNAGANNAGANNAGANNAGAKFAHEPLTRGMIDLFCGFTANDLFPVVTVKLGKRGAVVFAGGNVYREETIPVIPLETSGAGDTFCAAFLAAWIRDKSLAECAAFANRAARLVLDVQGAQADPRLMKTLARGLR